MEGQPMRAADSLSSGPGGPPSAAGYASEGRKLVFSCYSNAVDGPSNCVESQVFIRVERWFACVADPMGCDV